MTIATDKLGRTIGFLHPDQERALAVAVTPAFDLELGLMGG